MTKFCLKLTDYWLTLPNIKSTIYVQYGSTQRDPSADYGAGEVSLTSQKRERS